MDEHNPFAPLVPGADHLELGALGREGDQVRGNKVANWPDRCVRCNAPANGFRLRMTLQWHPRWVYLVLLLNVLFYAIAALITRRTAVVHVGLCPEHRQARKMTIVLALGLLLVSALSCGGGMTLLERSDALGIGLLVGTVALFAGLFVFTRVPPLRVVRVSKDEFWVRAGAPFLDSLPPVGP